MGGALAHQDHPGSAQYPVHGIQLRGGSNSLGHTPFTPQIVQCPTGRARLTVRLAVNVALYPSAKNDHCGQDAEQSSCDEKGPRRADQPSTTEQHRGDNDEGTRQPRDQRLVFLALHLERFDDLGETFLTRRALFLLSLLALRLVLLSRHITRVPAGARNPFRRSLLGYWPGDRCQRCTARAGLVAIARRLGPPATSCCPRTTWAGLRSGGGRNREDPGDHLSHP